MVLGTYVHLITFKVALLINYKLNLKVLGPVAGNIEVRIRVKSKPQPSLLIRHSEVSKIYSV
jgi:hypothetical protein